MTETSIAPAELLRGCSYAWDGTSLTLRTAAIERTYEFVEGRLLCRGLCHPVGGCRWGSPADPAPALDLPWLAGPANVENVTARVEDEAGLAAPFVRVSMQLTYPAHQVRIDWDLAPGLPAIASRMHVRGQPVAERKQAQQVGDHGPIESNRIGNAGTSDDVVDALPFARRHLKATAIALYDRTDRHYDLVRETQTLLTGRSWEDAEGNLLLLNDYLADEGLLLVKDAPTMLAALRRRGPEFRVHGSLGVQACGSGIDPAKLDADTWTPAYGCTIVLDRPDRLLRTYKRWYDRMRLVQPKRDLYVMSNTWGDRNKDAAVCESFIRREIETAAELGADIVQIDDGWQKGATANSALVQGGVWEGYHKCDPAFWDVHPKKFPRGLEPLVREANTRGVRIGLWFAPDSSDDFAAWRKDADTMLHLHRTFGICHFKLDSIKLRSKRGEIHLRSMLEAVTRESDGAVTFNMDTTAEERFGYVYEKAFGTIFLENRYSDWGNYVPHRTLRALWRLSRIIPSSRLQIEVLNNARNADKYGDDPLAPAHYGMDYLFAIAMVANPLLWMELSSLSASQRQTLAPLIKLYKALRKEMLSGEVLPVGDLPDGTTFTGFQSVTDPDSGFLLLFRENTAESTGNFALHDLAGRTVAWEVLHASAGLGQLPQRIGTDGRIMVSLPQPKSFALLRYRAES